MEDRHLAGLVAVLPGCLVRVETVIAEHQPLGQTLGDLHRGKEKIAGQDHQHLGRLDRAGLPGNDPAGKPQLLTADIDVVVLLAQTDKQHSPGLHRRLVAAVEQPGVEQQCLLFFALEVARRPALLQGPVQRPGGIRGQMGDILLHRIDEQVAVELAGIPAKHSHRFCVCLHRTVSSLTPGCRIPLSK